LVAKVSHCDPVDFLKKAITSLQRVSICPDALDEATRQHLLELLGSL